MKVVSQDVAIMAVKTITNNARTMIKYAAVSSSHKEDEILALEYLETVESAVISTFLDRAATDA